MRERGPANLRARVRRACAALGLLVFALGHAALARAQESEELDATQPPTVIRLQPLRLPADAPLPEHSHLDLAVLIEPDGRARLEQALTPDSLQLAAAEALARSEFGPARVQGVPVSARVRVRMPLVGAPLELGATPVTPSGPVALPQERAPEVRAAPTPAQVAETAAREPLRYGASGRLTLLLPTDRQLVLEEMRNLPGTFGDPFRVIDTLPGVVPQLSGLPYVYVRGAPPAGTLYFYDGIQVPGMFHLALGPAVVHPSLIDEVDFFASVAPARFGRFTGGVLSGGPSPRPPPARVSGELELRLIDLTARVEVPLLGGSLVLAGRYGYPGPVISLFSPQSNLNYWDYQTRWVLPLSRGTRFELVWFGSFDDVGFEDSLGRRSNYLLEFHRAEIRLIQQRGPLELFAGAQIGAERSRIDTGMRVSAMRIGPRVYAAYRGASGLRFRVGADMFGSVGSLYSAPSIEEGPIQIRLPFADDVAARSVMGLYGELNVPLTERLRVDLGLRSDLWLTASNAEAAADPRLTLSYRSHDAITWHGAIGLAHQPAVFLIPLPGISEIGLSRGLQSAVQSEAGVAVELPAALKLESQLYLQHFANMLLPELALEQASDCAGLPEDVARATARCNGGYPRSDVWAYGAEFFLRRSVTEALSGWVNYTIGWARAHSDSGQNFRPTFDVRHVVNLVLQYRLVAGFSASARIQYRSGKIANELFLRAEPVRYEQRLPGFFRADVSVSYGFRPSWGTLRVTLEWFNVTLSREATDIVCRDGIGVGSDPLQATPCRVQQAPALFFPNLGVRAEF